MRDPAATTPIDEYLALDGAAEGKLELLNGVVVAMAGASPRHNRIVHNVSRALGNALASRPCLVFAQDQRVHVAATQSYLYPDVVVVCEDPRFDTGARPASLTNPSLIVEVLSASTLDHDLGAKLGHYRRLPSVREVLFVHTETRALTLVTREGDGSWKLVDEGPEGHVEVAGVTLTFDVIYDRAESLPA
ncbi:MAG: Uma2 family endonuclease [Myxococcales bacterium]|nr:Uma2 family endonuclease [Myxococcales bacterium]